MQLPDLGLQYLISTIHSYFYTNRWKAWKPLNNYGEKNKNKKTEINVIIKIKTPHIEPEHSDVLLHLPKGKTERHREQRHYYL